MLRSYCSETFSEPRRLEAAGQRFDANAGGFGCREGTQNDFDRGDNLEAPISPGIYEVRIAGTGALHSFGAVDNLALAARTAAGRLEVVVRLARCDGRA